MHYGLTAIKSKRPFFLWLCILVCQQIPTEDSVYPFLLKHIPISSYFFPELDFFPSFCGYPFPSPSCRSSLQQTPIQYPLHNDYRAVWPRFWRCWGILYSLPCKLASSLLLLTWIAIICEMNHISLLYMAMNPVVLQLFFPILVTGQQVKIPQFLLCQFSRNTIIKKIIFQIYFYLLDKEYCNLHLIHWTYWHLVIQQYASDAVTVKYCGWVFENGQNFQY